MWQRSVALSIVHKSTNFIFDVDAARGVFITARQSCPDVIASEQKTTHKLLSVVKTGSFLFVTFEKLRLNITTVSFETKFALVKLVIKLVGRAIWN